MSKIREYVNGKGKNKPRDFIRDVAALSTNERGDLERTNEGYRVEVYSREKDNDR